MQLDIILRLTEVVESVLAKNSLFLSGEKKITIDFSRPVLPAHGDWSTNVCFELFKLKDQLSKLDEYKNPANLAIFLVSEINDNLRKAPLSWLKKVEAAGPFINFFLSDEYCFLVASSLLEKEGFNLEAEKNNSFLNKEYLVEFSSPNIAKPFTIGHLRSTIIGDAVANILQITGAKVYRDNHLGDWGTQFGKQIYAIKHWGDLSEIENSEQPVKELVDLYVKFHQEAEKQPEIEDEARAWFKKMEENNQEAMDLWRFCIEVSMKEFQRIYDLLGVQFTENNGRGYGESFFFDLMPAVIQELKDKHLLKESEGAQLVFFDEKTKLPPLMIVRSDGATLYSTRDLATDKFRFDTYGHDLTIINEVGAEQSLYFQQLYQTEKMLNWINDPGQRVHLKHGMYRFKDRKMSTRKGDVVWLDDVLNEAFSRVQMIAKSDDLDDELIWKIAIGAVKWNDLSKESARDVDFNLDEILNLKGNSGPYMQYSFVRALSVLQKGNGVGETADIDESLKLAQRRLGNGWLSETVETEEERNLLKEAVKYSELVFRAAEEKAPHILANYLYELAACLNTFYAKEVILGNDDRERLTLLSALILKQGLNLLGIEVIDRM